MPKLNAGLTLGVPISQLILATNVNDILTRAFDSGTMQIHEVVPSTSPAMDIQISSNFERLLFELLERWWLPPHRRGVSSR